MKRKQRISSPTSHKKKMAAAALIAGLTGAFLFLSSPSGRNVFVPAYTVARVIDGDTFETTEKQVVRLSSIEAPEKGLCGSDEATAGLKKLVMGKPVYFKVLFHDRFGRSESYVYSEGVFVNKVMIEEGYATHLNRNADSIDDILKKADTEARTKKKGIFGEKCTQMENKENPSCAIKGNTRNGTIYYLPNCGVYPNVIVQLYLGDRWFCSEKEALQAGFRKPSQCP